MGHQGHKGTAHRVPAGIQPLPEMDHLLLESLGVGMRSGLGHSHGLPSIWWPSLWVVSLTPCHTTSHLLPASGLGSKSFYFLSFFKN